MSSILHHVDSWIVAVTIGLLMYLAFAVGRWSGRAVPREPDNSPDSKLRDAILAVFGLLIGFTFSMSLGKHDQRRLMVVADSNAIGDFYTTSQLLKEPYRSRIAAIVREYVETRLETARARLTEPQLQLILAHVESLQGRLTAEVGEAVNAGTPVTIPLVNNLNAITSMHASRVAAMRDRLPGSIADVLFGSAILAMVVVGRHQGHTNVIHREATVGFIVLIGLVVWVTLDLNQPNRGSIVVSQEPMERLLGTMKKS